MFDGSLLAKTTWTGRSGVKNQKKITLKSYNKFLQLVKDLCYASDETYTEKKCESAIIYKIIKYAYRNKSNSESSSDSAGSSNNGKTEESNSVKPSTGTNAIDNGLPNQTDQQVSTVQHSIHPSNFQHLQAVQQASSSHSGVHATYPPPPTTYPPPLDYSHQQFQHEQKNSTQFPYNGYPPIPNHSYNTNNNIRQAHNNHFY